MSIRSLMRLYCARKSIIARVALATQKPTKLKQLLNWSKSPALQVFHRFKTICTVFQWTRILNVHLDSSHIHSVCQIFKCISTVRERAFFTNRVALQYRCRSYPVSVSGDISFKTLVDRNGMESL